MKPHRLLPPRAPSRLASLALVAVTLCACGGSDSSSSGPSGTAVPSASRTAVAPGSGEGAAATGFDASGAPVYALADESQTRWAVYAAKDRPLYEAPLTGIVDSRPRAVAGRFVVGNYEDAAGGHGVLVVSRAADGAVTSARYPGYRFAAASGGRALVNGYDDEDAFFLLDLASGALTPEPVPAGSVPYDFEGSKVLCSTGAQPRGAFVYDVDADASTPLQAAPDSDGRVEPAAVNAAGQALGVTYQGDRTDLRVWSAQGVPSDALDSVPSGYLEPGWISPDGTKLAYAKIVGNVGTAYLRTGGVAYSLRTEGFPLAALHGLDDAGKVGFGYDAGLDAQVTVKVSYR